MSLPTGYGVSNPGDELVQSRGTNRSGSTADLLDSNGKIVNQVVHSVAEEIQEEVFCDDKDTLLATLTAGQSGSEVITGINVTESNTDWCKATVTKRKLPDYDGSNA